MRISTSLPDGKWREVAEAARRFEELGFDQAASHEVQHDSFTTLVPATLSTNRIGLTTSVAIAFPRSPMIVAILAQDLNVNSNGRFVLGLGSQVKQHNERRFSTPWTPPAPRMGEYVQALRAIWRCWEKAGPLNFKGEHYNFTLMTPAFSPPPTGLPMVPVTIAAVGPAMLRLAGRHCDGVRLHAFCTRAYAEQVVVPEIEKGLSQSGRKRENFEISGGGFIVTGPDEASLAQSRERVRQQIGFYGSTPAYQPVLELHGLGDLAKKLNKLVRNGDWEKLAAQITDDVLDLFAAVATFEELPEKVAARFGDISDTIGLEFSPQSNAGAVRALLEKLRAIPSRFAAFSDKWANVPT
jgi:probable F420-dependent oxidoreductase